MSLSTVPATLGLALAFGLPAIGLYRRRRGSDDLEWSDVRRGLARTWLLFAAVVVLVGATGSPADLGLRAPSVGTFVDGVLFGFVAFAGTMLAVGLVLRAAGGLSVDEASLVVFDQPAGRRLAVALTSATVESVMFYGFVVETVGGLGADPWLAAVVAAAGVLLVRAQWGVRHAAQWVPGTLVLAGIAVATGTAVVVLVVRLGYDVVVTVSADADDYDAVARSR